MVNANYDDVMRGQFRNLFERYAKHFMDWVWKGGGTTPEDLETARMQMMQQVDNATAAQARGNADSQRAEQPIPVDAEQEVIGDDFLDSESFRRVRDQENPPP